MSNELWTPVIVRHHGKAFEEAVCENYEVSDKCRIRNTKTQKILSDKIDRIGLWCNGICKILSRHRICLASFYPDKIPDDINNYDVDHIDGNHDNNILYNLQWLSKSEHCKKTNIQTKGRRKSLIHNSGKTIKIVDVKNNGRKELLGSVFGSSHCAASKLELQQGSISASARKGTWAGCYKFIFVEQHILKGEKFKPLGNGYQVSNKGRIKMKRGKITKGTNVIGTKYRQVNIKLNNDVKPRKYCVHKLVWIAFIGPIPEGKVVMHDDTYNTLDEEGRERNWLEDLSLGTYSENSQSYQDNRKDLKRVRCIENGKEYFNATEAAKDLNLHRSKIHLVCKKKRNTTGGYRFEYV